MTVFQYLEYVIVQPLSAPSPTPVQTATPQSTPTPTTTVPEFPTLIILPLFTVAIFLSSVVIRNRTPKKPKK